MRRADAEDNELELELMPDGNDGVDAATVEAESGTWGGTNGWRSKSKSMALLREEPGVEGRQRWL